MSVRLSLAWTYLAQAISFLVTFASTVVVARLVSPRDFGIFAMAGAIATIINVLLQFGLAKYIMREKELSRDLLRSVFTVNVVMTIVYVLAILIGAIAAGSAFGSAEVSQFLIVFALFPLFAMMEFVPAALCARDMRFGMIAGMAVLRAVVMAAATIIFALLGFAFMSFAWAQVLAWIATAIGFNLAVWRPDVWRIRFRGIRAILHFGSQMIGISGLSQLATRAGEMTLGSMLGLTSLGLYTRAASLPTTLHANVLGAGSNVIFSRLSQELRATGDFHLTYIRFMRLLLGILWPMLVGLAVLSQPLIHILYGREWQAAATPLALLSLSAAITLAIGLATEIFILKHATPRQVRLEAVRAGVGLSLFAGGATISITLAAAAKIAEAIVALLLYRRAMSELIEAPDGALRRVYSEGLILTLPAVLPALMLMAAHDWSPETPVPLIIGSVILGVLLWGSALLIRGHPIAAECLRLVRPAARAPLDRA